MQSSDGTFTDSNYPVIRFSMISSSAELRKQAESGMHFYLLTNNLSLNTVHYPKRNTFAPPFPETRRSGGASLCTMRLIH